MALPLPMLSVLLSTLFACSLAFRDCKKTRETVNNWSHILTVRHSGLWWGCEVSFWVYFVCWGERACLNTCVKRREGESLDVRGGEFFCFSFEHLQYLWRNSTFCKIKVSKRSLKLTDKQTSGTNSSNIDVQVQKKNLKKKKKKRDQTKTTLDTSQHRGDQGRPHIESWLSPETLCEGERGDPSLALSGLADQLLLYPV